MSVIILLAKKNHFISYKLVNCEEIIGIDRRWKLLNAAKCLLGLRRGKVLGTDLVAHNLVHNLVVHNLPQPSARPSGAQASAQASAQPSMHVRGILHQQLGVYGGTLMCAGHAAAVPWRQLISDGWMATWPPTYIHLVTTLHTNLPGAF